MSLAAVPLDRLQRRAVLAELQRCFRPPYEAPLILAANAAMVFFGWFLLPESLRDWLFSLHGPLAFPALLESWMLADVPATNVLGSDPAGARQALTHPQTLPRFLAAKRMAIWLLVAPLCAALAIAIGVVRHTYISAIAISVVLLILPYAVLTVSAWFGILFPYRPYPLQLRWQRRYHLLETAGWLMATIVIPYTFVPAIVGVLITPSVAISRVVSGGPARGLGPLHFVLGAGLACGTALLVASFGHRVAVWLCRRSRGRLITWFGRTG